MTGDTMLPVEPGTETVLEMGEGGLNGMDDVIDFEPGSELPAHLFYWRLPVRKNYAISSKQHPNALMMQSSVYNLTSFDGDSTRGLGQTYVARRQEHIGIQFSLDSAWDGRLTRELNEVGVTALQGQVQHFDMGVVMLKGNGPSDGNLEPHLRFRGISTTTYRLPERFKYVEDTFSLPEHRRGRKLRLQVEAVNTTHYAFSAGPGGMDEKTEMTVYGYTRGNYLVPYRSGAVVGPYATSNGKRDEGAFKTIVSRWRYTGLEQVRELPEDQVRI